MLELSTWTISLDALQDLRNLYELYLMSAALHGGFGDHGKTHNDTNFRGVRPQWSSQWPLQTPRKLVAEGGDAKTPENSSFTFETICIREMILFNLRLFKKFKLQNGLFWSSLICIRFLGCLNNVSFKVKTYGAKFWATVGKIGLFFSRTSGHINWKVMAGILCLDLWCHRQHRHSHCSSFMIIDTLF